MIETYTIAGPVAQLRTMMTTLAQDMPRAEPLIPPDPAAPTGPRPSFEATPLERLRDMPPVERMRRCDAAGLPRSATGGTPAEGGGPALDNRTARRLDRTV